jgi:hypothetical protein
MKEGGVFLNNSLIKSIVQPRSVDLVTKMSTERIGFSLGRLRTFTGSLTVPGETGVPISSFYKKSSFFKNLNKS